MNGSISFKEVVKTYGEQTVLRDLCLEVLDGELLTVIGASGCGKTTALKMINGLIEPDSGTVSVGGNVVSSLGEAERIRLRRHIGYVIQGIGLFPHLSIEDNIAYVPDLMGEDKKATRKRVRELCALIGLDAEMLNRYPSGLSGGQQQRVGIARALAASPRIMLMDEPFGAVDAITRSRLQQELLKIHEELAMTIIFVTHDVDEALLLGNRVLVMAAGSIEQFDTPEVITSNPGTPFVADLLGARPACM